MAHFGLAQNPPTTNTIAAFTIRDINVFVPRSADVLVKANTTQCPLTGDTGAECAGEVTCLPGDDDDGDGVCDGDDNCPLVSNPGQTNSDGDPLGDACDNCPLVTNAGQEDGDGDGDGNVCDNCPTVANPGQEDGAGGLENTIGGVFSPDGVGDACDNCVRVNNPRQVAGYLTTNPWRTLTGDQIDDDHDGYGNRCDAKFVGLPSRQSAVWISHSSGLRTTRTGASTPAGPSTRARARSSIWTKRRSATRLVVSTSVASAS